VIIRDDNVFRYFAPDTPAQIPEGLSAPLEIKATADRVREREEWLERTVVCECCAGSGRVPAPTPVGAA